MPVLSNTKYENFAQQMAKGVAATDAYAAVGYPRTPASATRLSRRPEVQSRIKEIQEARAKRNLDMEIEASEKVAKKLGITKEMVIQGLWYNAQRCLRGQPVLDANGIQTGRFAGKPDANGANAALRLVGMECFGMFIERHEIGGPGDFSRLTDEELAKRALEDASALGLPAAATEALLLTFQPVAQESSDDGSE